jgi:hypothetical protein
MAATLEVIISGVDRLSPVLKDVDKEASGVSKTLGSVGKLAALGAAAGIGVAITAGINFTKVASDLNESANKAAVIFGNSIKPVQDFAQTSASAFGISKRAALEYTGTLGTILNASGVTEGASADMSVQLTKLAADLASFNNIPIDEALEKIRAGLVGEAEPLRTVGVLLSEAAVKEKAYQMGLAQTGEELTDAQKVQARYALIMEQTAKQQGDFTRTSDSLANRQRIIKANWENIRATLGNLILPVVTKVGVALSDFLTENQDEINELAERFEQWANSDLWPTLESAFTQLKQLVQGVVDTGILQFLEDNKLALVAVGLALGALVIAFGGPILIIPTLIAAGALLLAHWDDIRNKVSEIVADFEEKFPALARIVDFVFEMIKARVEFWINTVRAIIQIVTSLIRGDFDGAWNGIRDLLNGILELVLGDVNRVFGLARDGAVAAINEIPGLLRGLAGVFTSAMEELGLAMLRGLMQGLGKAAGFVGGMASGLLGAIKSLINTQIIDRINNALEFKIKVPWGRDISIDAPDIPRLAHGGIVTRPTLALIGEAGPEAVVPLSRAGVGAGATHIHIHAGAFMGTPADARRFALLLRDSLRGAV